MNLTDSNISEAAANATSKNGQSHSHSTEPHAHHLKWGDIQTSGFAPPEIQSDDASDLDDPCHGTKDSANRRHKMSRDRSREIIDAEARRIHGQRRYLFRKPRPLQYFRGKVLVRSNEERGSGRLELFFDLTFVGIIAVLAQAAIADPTGAGLVRYIITYTAAYMIWNWMREIFDAFYKDDLTQRILVLFVMACLVLYGNNAIKAEQNLDEGPARAVTIASFLIADAAIFATWMLYSFYVKAYRIQMRAHFCAWLISVALMIGSIFVGVRAAIAMSVVAILWEWSTWMFFYSPIFKRVIKLRYSSAIAIDHQTERAMDFVTIVLGEFVYSLFDGNPTSIGFHISGGKAIMALMIAFSFQLMYMNGGGSRTITHPLRHSVFRALAFFNLHLPLVSSLTLCGDAMGDFIRENHVESGVRWFACESFAIAMFSLWLLGMLEHERDEPGVLWLPKWARLLPRLIAGIITVFLPLTHQANEEEGGVIVEAVLSVAAETVEEGGIDMTTTKLLGIMTSLAFFALLWEIITSLDGKNAPSESAPTHIFDRANGHGISALSTPKWRGFPRFAEPGSGTFDKSHQRNHGELTPTTSIASSA